MRRAVARNDRSRLQVVVVARHQVRHLPARLPDQQRSRGGVPRVQIALEVRGEPPRGDPRQHDRRASQHPNAPNRQIRERLHPLQHRVRALGGGAVAGDHDRLLPGSLLADAHRGEVAVRAAAEARAEDLPRERVHYDANLKLALVRDADGDCGEGHAVDEVGRAVDGVDDPEPVRAGVEQTRDRGAARLPPARHALLPEEAVRRERVRDGRLDDALHLRVNLGEEIARVGLRLDHVRAELVEHDGRAELGGVGGDLETRPAHRGEVILVQGGESALGERAHRIRIVVALRVRVGRGERATPGGRGAAGAAGDRGARMWREVVDRADGGGGHRCASAFTCERPRDWWIPFYPCVIRESSPGFSSVRVNNGSTHSSALSAP